MHAENLLNKHHLSAGRRRVEVVITVPALKAQETLKATQIHLCLLLILPSIAPPWCPSVDRLRSSPVRPRKITPDHGFKILRPGNLSRARHTSPPGKGGEANMTNSQHPVAATTRIRLHLPSRKITFRKVQNQPGQIEASDLASFLTPKSSL